MKEKIIFYIIGFIAMIIACLYPFYQVNDSVTIDEIQGVFQRYVDNENWKQRDKQFIRKYYQLDSKDYQKMLSYTSPSAMEVDEITVIKSENTEKIMDAFSQRIKFQLNNFNGYGIEQCDLLNHAIVFEKGHYVILIVNENASDIYKDLQALF